MSNALKIKEALVLAAIVAPLILAGCYSTRSHGTDTPGTREFGPVYCRECAVSFPFPDNKTLDLLGREQTANHLVTGDKVMVCNDQACVDYKMSSEGLWKGVEREAQIGPIGSTDPSSPGGTGSPPPDPRLGNIDCWYCSGTVIVGDISKN